MHPLLLIGGYNFLEIKQQEILPYLYKFFTPNLKYFVDYLLQLKKMMHNTETIRKYFFIYLNFFQAVKFRSINLFTSVTSEVALTIKIKKIKLILFI